MILLLAAMDAEIDAIVKTLEEKQQTEWAGQVRFSGRLEGKQVVVAKTGVGKTMAALTVQHLIDEYNPRATIFTGLAGSVRDSVRIGDTVVARDLVQHDLDATSLGFPLGSIPYTGYRFLHCDPELLEAGLGYKPAAGQVHAGRIGTGDQFVTAVTLNARPEIKVELSCDAVEMEGASAALVCTVNKVRFLVARTISDMADGGAHIDFADFLAKAGTNSLAFVRHMLLTAEF